MTWTAIWMRLFGTTTLLGLDMGFWVAMAVVVLIVILMNVVFWSMKPKQNTSLSASSGVQTVDPEAADRAAL